MATTPPVLPAYDPGTEADPVCSEIPTELDRLVGSWNDVLRREWFDYLFRADGDPLRAWSLIEDGLAQTPGGDQVVAAVAVGDLETAAAHLRGLLERRASDPTTPTLRSEIPRGIPASAWARP